MRVIKESVIKKHSYENGDHSSYIELIERYHYDSEEERNKHAEHLYGSEVTINMKETRQANKSFNREMEE